MKADTRLFGQIEIEDEKILYFEQGIIGFPDLKHFALIFDAEKETVHISNGCSPWKNRAMHCRS